MPEMSANSACKDVGISQSVFNLWVHKDPIMYERYAHVRYDYLERLHEMMWQLLDINADDISKDNKGRTDSGAIQLLKLKIDTIKWELAKGLPKKYGERLALANDEDSPIPITNITMNVVRSSDDS